MFMKKLNIEIMKPTYFGNIDLTESFLKCGFHMIIENKF